MSNNNQVSTATRLASQTPDQVNSLVASLAQQFDVTLSKKAAMKGGAELPDGTRTPVVYEWHWDAKGKTADQALAASERVQGSMTPASQNQIAGWIAELSVISARRVDDQMTDDLRLASYSKRLTEYPADIARHVLLDMRWKFFPTWADLADACDKLREQRQSMIDSIKREAERLRKREESDKPRDEREVGKTAEDIQEERKRFAAEVLAGAGFRNVMKDFE